MSEENNTSESLQFNIGKSFGMEEKHTPIDEFKTKIEEMNTLYKLKTAEGLSVFKVNCQDIKTLLEQIYNKAVKDHEALRDQSGTLITYLSGLLNQDIKENPWLQQQLQGLFQATINKNLKYLEGVFNLEIELGLKLAGLNSKLDTMINKSDELWDVYLKELKSMNVSFIDMENGYNFGLALKTALNPS